jgi:hypothetical protein
LRYGLLEIRHAVVGFRLPRRVLMQGVVQWN